LELFAAASFVATLLSGLVVGARLLALARVTHKAPELFLGAAVMLIALAALLEVSAMELAQREREPLAYPIEVVGLLLHSASSASLCFGIWRVFYPDRSFAPRLCLVLTVVLFESWAVVVLPGRHTSMMGFTPWFHLHVAARGATFAWAAVSAFSYYRRMVRRVALDLADPILCHRFLLWAVAMASTTGMLVTALFTNTTRGVLVFAWTPALLLVSALGLVSAWSLWFAFLPPVAYQRLIRRRIRAAPA
jgi:hypothetical protein